MEDLVQGIQAGLLLGPTTVLCLTATMSAVACLLLPKLPALSAMEVTPPADNPCHAAGVKSKIGGLAVVGTALLISTLSSGTASPWRPLSIYLAGLFLIGLLDDVQPLTPGWKIILQFPMALFLVLSIPRTGWVHMGLPWVVIQVGWLLVMTNAFNIVDVADGLLAGLALPALALAGAIHLNDGAPEIGILALSFSGALLGFMLFNSSWGRVMLGDTGSLPLGGLVAAMALLIPSRDGASASAMLWAVPLTGVVMFEVAWVSVRRLRAGILPWRGSPHHLIYWLVERGLSISTAVVVLSAVQIGLLLPMAATRSTWIWLVPAGVGFTILIVAPRLRRRTQRG